MGLSNWLRAVLNRLCEVLKRQPANEGLSNSPQYSLLARFIFQKSQFSKSAAKPKPGAFLPAPSKTSAIWRDELPELDIWNIGDFLGKARGKQPVARADFDSKAVSEAELEIESDPKPHPRHVNLSKWPIDKDTQKSIALLLCARSTLVVR